MCSNTTSQYKCDYSGVWFDEVDEAYSAQTCSCCNRRTGPRGLKVLNCRMRMLSPKLLRLHLCKAP
ncbi:zinc ribbon domain-containing protein [Paraburkholderia sp.]|uniref:zinc ribbon domain-containing protein n=1 Tax=Paraburkholderia sp. TaxID=1926495 RepID=UPI003C78A657